MTQSEAVSVSCRVYWGSHGCCLERGHDGSLMPRDNWDDEGHWVNVGAPPYYGPDTRFYGDDA